jgi:putative bacteroidetes-specific membrane protein
VVPVEPPKPVEKKKEEIKPVPVQTDAPLAVKTEKMKGVTEGYYVVIGVYANPRNAFNERQRLGKRYDVGTFVNSKNGYTYLYLGKGVMSAEEAQSLMRKNMMKEDFYGGIWILEVKLEK